MTSKRIETNSKRNTLPSRHIADMRGYYEMGYRISELASHYGVHESVASDICHGRTHKRVLPAENLPALPVQRTPEEQAERARRIMESINHSRNPRR